VVVLGWSAALWLSWAAAGEYEMGEFLGISQISGRVKSNPLTQSGVLNRVRHPWYSAGFLILWLRDMTTYDLMTAVILSAYLVIGAFLEERKLVNLYAEDYCIYRKQVPMFIPDFFKRY